jgi:MoaA/NifB/PqqE/SkfB family radical SAM enzyme
MKQTLRSILAAAALSLTLGLGAHAEKSASGFIDFGKFTPPAAGGEFVEVNLKGNLLSMVAGVAGKEEPEVADLLKGLEAVRVNVIGLDEGNRKDTEAHVQSIRSELESKGWERIVSAQEKDQDVGVYLRTRGKEAIAGLVVTVVENGKQVVLVNVVGDIRPDQLNALGDKLDIEPLKKLHSVTHKEKEGDKSDDKK